MTATIIPFPRKEALRAITGIDKATGRPVMMLEHVSAQGRMVVAECGSAAEFDRALQAWLAGEDVNPWPDDAA